MKPESRDRKQSPGVPKGLSSAGGRFAIVASRFNPQVMERLVAGALEAFRQTGTRADDVSVVRVPGAFELPLGVARLVETEKYDAIVALACVIRGETAHFDHISRAATDGLQHVMLDTGIPVGFGLLTTENMEQALARSAGEGNNKGFDAAIAAIEMARFRRDGGCAGAS